MHKKAWIGAASLAVVLILLGPLSSMRAADDVWRGEYFENRNLRGAPSEVRYDREISFDWGLGAPFPDWKPDNFSVRWTKIATFESGLYVFGVRSDDGARILLDGQVIVDNWRDGAHGWQIGEANVTAGQHVVVVEYYEGSTSAYVEAAYYPFDEPGPFWRGEFFSNRDLAGDPDAVLHYDVLTLDWGYGVPFPFYYADRFSARFTRTDLFSGQPYTFSARADDGVRVYVDGELIIDRWGGEQFLWHSVEKLMTPGEHTIVVEYFENVGQARVQVGYYPRDPSIRPVTLTPTSAATFTPTPTETLPPGVQPAGAPAVSSGGGQVVRPTVPPPPTQTPTHTPTPTATLPYIVGTPGQIAMQLPPGVAMADGIVVDDADGKLFSWTGFPGLVVAEGGHGGTYSYVKNRADRATVEGRWIFKPGLDGFYDVYASIPQSPSALTASARYVVHHAGNVSAPILIDQAASAGQWVWLGNYYFAKMAGQAVLLDNLTGEPSASRVVAFDALLFVPGQ